MNFLGINASHSESIDLMINRKIKIVFQEEIFTKIKIYLEKLKKNLKNINNISLTFKKLNFLTNDNFKGLCNLLALGLRNHFKKISKNNIFSKGPKDLSLISIKKLLKYKIFFSI